MADTGRMTKPDLADREWLTYATAAATYGVSTRTLRRLASAGAIRRVHAPHRRTSVLLSVADLDAVLGGVHGAEH